MCFSGNGFAEAMLEPYMKLSEMQASQWEVSLTFMVLGACYMVTSPLAGYVS